MGFFRKSAPGEEQASSLGRDDTLPADVRSGSMTDRLATGANAALDKAAQVYNRNPKLIGGLAAVAGAILLTRMKRGARS